MAELSFEQISKTFEDGTRAVRDFTLRCEDGEFVVLVGPSGCGKSTLLRMGAGLEEPSAGLIRIDGRAVNDLTPQARNVAMVFQNYALYPHMTVRRNLAFPLKMGGVDRRETEQRVQKVARLLGLESVLDRRPRQLSGGQRQRVAMGRALVREPAVFLMDEPLSNLDAKLRVQMRGEITSLQQRLGITTLYVTHDQIEAMTMGDRLAVLHQGRLQQCGTPGEIYQHPTNVFVATFIGSPAMNLFRATLEKTADGSASIHWGNRQWDWPSELAEAVVRRASGETLLCGLRPEALAVEDTGDAALSFPARAENVELLGHEQIVRFSTDVPVLSERAIGRIVGGTTPEDRKEDPGSLVARFSTATHITRGDLVPLTFRPRALHLFSPDGNSLHVGS